MQTPKQETFFLSEYVHVLLHRKAGQDTLMLFETFERG